MLIICIKKKAREVFRKYNKEIIRITILALKISRKVRRTQKLGQDILVTLLDKQSIEIHGQ